MLGESIILGEYQLSLDKGTGIIVGLRRGEGPEVMGPGLGIDLPEVRFGKTAMVGKPRYVSHVKSDNTLTIQIDLEPLRLIDTFSYANGLLERRITLENHSDHELQVLGVRIGLAGVSIDAPADCLFEAPANVIRPRQRLSAAASQEIHPTRNSNWDQPDYSEAFAPGIRHVWNGAIAPLP